MPGSQPHAEIRLLNGSTGDPVLFVDYPGRDDALLFDAGENDRLGLERLADLDAVFITHHHIDHFIGFDRIVRANLDRDKALQVFGPRGTIRKIYYRIKSYAFPKFPFRKVILNVHEVWPDAIRTGLLECSRRFPRPVVHDVTWSGPTIHETDHLTVEAVHVDHTTPCLAYAVVEKPGWHADPVKLAAGPLPAGAWVGEALKRLRAGGAEATSIVVEGAPQPLSALRDAYFVESPGARVAYVTDTAWSDPIRPALRALAHRASRLYCDSFYAREELAKAGRHHHMTAEQAGELAREAEVDELVLIHFAPRYQGDYARLVAQAREQFPRVSAELPGLSSTV